MARTTAATLNLILVEIKMLNERMFAAQTAAAAKEVSAVGDAAEKTGVKMKAASFNAGLFGKAITGMAKVAKLGAATAIVAVGIAIDSGINFQQEMAKVASITRGAVGATFQAMNQAALEAATNTRFSAKEAAEALYLLGRAGFTAKQELTALPGVLNLAHAAAVPLSLAAEVMGETLRGFNLQAKDAGLVTDTLARATAGGAVGLTDLRYSIKYIGSMASATHQPLAQMVALLELMARHGIKGSQAGTTLRSMMTRLTRPVKMVTDGMALLGMTASDYKGPHGLLPLDQIFNTIRNKMKLLDPNTANKAVAQIFGQWASSGAFAVLNAPKGQLEQFMKALDPNKVRGSAHQIASILNDTVQMQLLRMWHTLQAVGIGLTLPFGDKAKSLLMSFNDHVSGVVTGMEGLQYAVQHGHWRDFAIGIDLMTGSGGKLEFAIDTLRDTFGGLWSILHDSVWPIFKQLAYVVGVSLFGALLLVNGILGFFAGHATTTKALIWLLIGAYTAWKLVTWACTAAVWWNDFSLASSNLVVGGRIILNSALATSFMGVASAVWASTVALLANPLTWIVVGVILLIAGLVILYYKWRAFHNVVDAFANWIWDHYEILAFVPVFGQLLVGISWAIHHWQMMKDFFSHPIAGLEHIWDSLKTNFVKILNWIIKKWNSVAGKFAFSTPNIPGTNTGGIDFGGLPRIGLIGDDNGTPSTSGMMTTSVGNKFPPKVLDPFGPKEKDNIWQVPPLIVNLDGKEIARNTNKHNAHTRARH